MVEYDKIGKGIDCLVSLKVMVDREGEMTHEELEQIDDQMLKVGSSRTGQRIGVSTTKMEKSATVKYIYQESLLSMSIATAEDRLEAFTDFDSPTIFVDTEVVEYK